MFTNFCYVLNRLQIDFLVCKNVLVKWISLFIRYPNIGSMILISFMIVDQKEHFYIPGREREPLFQGVCNGNIKSDGRKRPNIFDTTYYQPKCHLVHHNNPFANLGPFHIEIKIYYPLRSIIHDFFTEKEMDWMLEYSKPRLTASRNAAVPDSTKSLTKSKLRYDTKKKTGYTVGKAVTAWLDDITYDEEQRYQRISSENESPIYQPDPLHDPYRYTLRHSIMLGISKKIELATNFNVTTRHGASSYQTTNYGLAGKYEIVFLENRELIY